MLFEEAFEQFRKGGIEDARQEDPQDWMGAVLSQQGPRAEANQLRCNTTPPQSRVQLFTPARDAHPAPRYRPCSTCMPRIGILVTKSLQMM